MAKSLGEALSKGMPAVFTSKDDVPNVVCERGMESEALKLLEDMNLICILRSHEGEDKISDGVQWTRLVAKLLKLVTDQHIPSSALAPRAFVSSLNMASSNLKQLIDRRGK